MRIAVLVSGNGSNLQALIDTDLAQYNGQIVGVISNRPDAYALQRAQQAGIATAILVHQDFADRASFDEKMHAQLLHWNVDLVVLAGFMRILTADFVQLWRGRMLNIHPSLLPAYKGTHTHRRVLTTGDRLHGCTVHFVTAELDAGAAIAQGVLQVGPHDTADTLAQRVHLLEHRLYPLVVKWYCQNQVRLVDGQLMVHQQLMQQPVRYFYD